MIRIIALILLSFPVFAKPPTDKELAYLEMLDYRLNMIAINNDIANSLGEVLIELRLIRCKIEPIEQDCLDNQEHKHGIVQ